MTIRHFYKEIYSGSEEIYMRSNSHFIEVQFGMCSNRYDFPQKFSQPDFVLPQHLIR